MKSLLKNSPEHYWEKMGILFGLVGCSSISAQVFHEWVTPEPSTLSWYFLFGFAAVYLFWLFYGIRFRHLGIWLPNVFAVLLQVTLALLVVAKHSP